MSVRTVARVGDVNTSHCGESPLLPIGTSFGRSDGIQVRVNGDPIKTHNIPPGGCLIPHSPVLDVPSDRFTRSDHIPVARTGDGFTPQCTEVKEHDAFWRVG